jgi:hypothetical protein
MDHQSTTAAERRDQPRATLEGNVTVRFREGALVGPGQNVSDEGVFFVGGGAITVEVELPDGSRRTGEVVRVQSMGDKQLGLAVRFIERSPRHAWREDEDIEAE